LNTIHIKKLTLYSEYNVQIYKVSGENKIAYMLSVETAIGENYYIPLLFIVTICKTGVFMLNYKSEVLEIFNNWLTLTQLRLGNEVK